jgi:hypothetical protein
MSVISVTRNGFRIVCLQIIEYLCSFISFVRFESGDSSVFLDTPGLLDGGECLVSSPGRFAPREAAVG